MSLFFLIAVIFFILLFLVFETIMTSGRVAFLRHRIIVNGTRGKSSVTELIHSGLSSEPTLGKITGVIPQLIYPDGTHSIIRRKGRARVQEQIRTLRTAVKLRVNNLVMECMSLNPELQKLETRVIKPTVYVITNIRNDHFEVMGKTLPEQAESICEAIPANSIVVTGEKDFLPLIESNAKLKNSKVISVALTEDDMDFVKLNLAIALKVCWLCGIDKSDAIERINQKKEPISPCIYELPGDSKFIDGFAVNDTPSAGQFLQKFRAQYANLKKLVIVLNTRNDRPFRSLEFARWINSLENEFLHSVILAGDHTGYTERKLIKLGFSPKKIKVWRKKDFNFPEDTFLKAGFDESLILGIGNIAGDGFKFLNSLKRNREL